MRTGRVRSAAALGRPRDPDQRNDQNKDDRRDEEDIVQPHHRGLCVDREVEQRVRGLGVQMQQRLGRIHLLIEQRIVDRGLLRQPRVMQDGAVVPLVAGDGGAHRAAEHPREVRQARGRRDLLRRLARTG